MQYEYGLFEFMSVESSHSLVFDNLTLGYQSHPAIHHLSGAISRASLTAIVGANGSGKSTLLKGIVGLLRPMSGELNLAHDQRVAYLPQQSELDRTFPARVRDVVAMGLWDKCGLLQRRSAEDHNSVREALMAVGLEGFDDRPIDSLSGGQLQRVLFARVLVQDANLILLDEPFNAIDSKTVSDLVALIHRWHQEERTILVVVHDLELVRDHFENALLLARHPVAWGDVDTVLQPENLLKARNFRETWDEEAPWCDVSDHDGHVLHKHKKSSAGSSAEIRDTVTG